MIHSIRSSILTDEEKVQVFKTLRNDKDINDELLLKVATVISSEYPSYSYSSIEDKLAVRDAPGGC